jgi:monoamine oxidase
MLGAVGGTSVMVGAMSSLDLMAAAQEAPPELEGSGEGRRVIILGAGVAGMTAAYELDGLGYDCEIIEARDFAGGRVQTARQGFELTEAGGERQVCQFDEGHYINHGPWRIPQHHRSTLHYCKEFGVALETMVNENENAYVYREDALGPLSGQRVRLREIKADLRGYVNELLAKAVNADELDLELGAEDRERLVGFLVREGYLDSEDLAYRGAGARGYETDPGAGLEPGEGEPSDPYDFSALLQAGMGNHFRSVASYNQQMTMMQPVGGMDRLAKGFEEAIGHLITFGAEVREIRQNDDGVRVVYEDRESGETSEVSADYCICTIPLSVLTQIPGDFSGDMQRAIRAVPYTPTGKIGLQFARRFWEEDDFIYGGHSETNLPIGSISYPSYGYHAQKGVLQGYYNFTDTAIEVSNMDLQGRTNFALEHGGKVHPQYSEEFENAFSVAWHRVRYSLGGWANYSSEARREHYPRLNEADGRIYLAGEHLSYLTGWMAGGIESAWLQLEKLHERAQQEGSARREGRAA